MKRTVGTHARLARATGDDGFHPLWSEHAGTQPATREPTRMTSAERMAELGGILALGFRRFVLSSQKALDDAGETERPCTSVDGHEKTQREDVA